MGLQLATFQMLRIIPCVAVFYCFLYIFYNNNSSSFIDRTSSCGAGSIVEPLYFILLSNLSKFTPISF